MDRSGFPGFGYSDVDFADDVPGPPPLLGDFYRECDDVTRGVNLFVAPSSPQGWHSSIYKSVDPYPEHDDVTRSVTLASDYPYLDSQPYSKLGFSEPSGFGEYDFQKSAFSDAHAVGAFDQGSSSDKLTQFAENDMLPQAPTDPFFTFAVTTLVISCERPHILMNDFLEFLRVKVAAEILKIRPQKYWIKTNAFLENSMCTFKARAYQQEPGEIVFEFQRRSGDTIAFNGIYTKAALFLQTRHTIIRGMPEAKLQTSAPLPQGKLNAADLKPILDLASQDSLPELQAEAASAMSSLAADSETLDALCTDTGVVEAVKLLLKTDRVDICHPTAKLLLRLACSSSAMNFFFGEEALDRGLLHILLEKVLCYSVSEVSIVLPQLLEVIVTVVRNCALRLPQQEANLLADQIARAMTRTSKERSDIKGRLQEAYLLLMQRG
jgi:hypothetical protein